MFVKVYFDAPSRSCTSFTLKSLVYIKLLSTLTTSNAHGLVYTAYTLHLLQGILSFSIYIHTSFNLHVVPLNFYTLQ